MSLDEALGDLRAYREITGRRDALIRAARAAGADITTISREGGISRPTVYEALKGGARTGNDERGTELLSEMPRELTYIGVRRVGDHERMTQGTVRDYRGPAGAREAFVAWETHEREWVPASCLLVLGGQ